MSEEQRDNRPGNLKKGNLFKKGQSGNPKGRPPVKKWRESFEAELKDEDMVEGKSNQDIIAAKVIARAKRGNLSAVKIIMETIPGAKAPTQIEEGTLLPVQFVITKDSATLAPGEKGKVTLSDLLKPKEPTE